MARPIRYRTPKMHEVAAGGVLQRYESIIGSAVSLPIPVEDIIERQFDLAVLRDEIPDPQGVRILGALSPSDRTIVLNTNHQDLFDQVMGPERFTLAHELGHWLYDADDPQQGTLDLGTDVARVFCRSKTGHLSDNDSRREINANGFASALLLPKRLIEVADLDDLLTNFRVRAHEWGVSQQALRIRLEALDLVDDVDLAQLDFNQ